MLHSSRACAAIVGRFHAFFSLFTILALAAQRPLRLPLCTFAAVVCGIVLALPATAALAQSISITPSPTTFSAAGETINFDITVNSGSYELLTLDSVTDRSGRTTPNCNFSPPVAPLATFNCTASYVTTPSDVSLGSFYILLEMSGTRTGGSWNASHRTDVLRQGGSTNTSVSVFPNPADPGQTITIEADVTPVGTGTPTGTVNFVIGPPASPVQTGSGTLSSGTATFMTSSLPPGTYAVRAEYLGDGTYTGSSGSGPDLTVNRIGTTTSLVSSTNPSHVAEDVTFTATVSADSGGGIPTGDVTFTIDGVPQAPVTLSGGEATLSTDTLGAGDHTIVATYGGDSSHDPSTSPDFTQTVNKAAATVTLAADLGSSLVGEEVTFTATVTGGPLTPTGDVTFVVDGGTPMTVPLSGTRATFSTDTLDAGNHSVVATYSGDAAHVAASDSLTHTVFKDGTTLGLASSTNPSIVGEIVTFTATIRADTGVVPLTGDVTFAVDGGTPMTVPLSGTRATFSTDTLDAGNHSVVATYSGDAAHAGASDGLNHAVDRDITTTALSSDVNPSLVGQLVTFTATVDPDTGVTPPTGTVTFSVDGTAQPPVTLSGGQATFSTDTLDAGDHTITAAYSGDGGHSPSSDTLTQSVDKIGTGTTLVSSLNPSDFGDAVTFTATVTPDSGRGTPTGTVTFTVDGAAAATASLAGGTATFTTTDLAVGSHQVVAEYKGTAAHAESESPPLAQTVRALGTVVIRQVTDGPDGTFTFTSPEPDLNLSISTSKGSGESAPVDLATGTYSITVADMTGSGFALTDLSCSDADSTGDVASRTATIALAPAETVVCTFSAINSQERTSELIEDFLDARGSLILASQPDMQRRIDRLNGVSGGGNPVSSLMSFLPGLAQGDSFSISASLDGISHLARPDAEPSRFDIWFQGSHTRFHADGPEGRFTAGAFGADYLVTPDLLVGGFVMVDHTSQSYDDDPATIEGTGWLAGPYVTTRLTQNLYLDVLAAAGTSSNTISPLGTYEDDFSTTRFLASAALQGEWERGPWTFSPRARLAWFQERSASYVDSLGVTIPSVDVGQGELAFGPGVGYRHVTQDGAVIEPGIRFEGVVGYLDDSAGSRFRDFRARFEGGIEVQAPGGARLAITGTYDGIGSNELSTYGGRVEFSIPLN